jgi:hypothetical protein
MKLYQPFLYVGLGGSGCTIGAALERRLREEICGPDGTAFKGSRTEPHRYQLPSCIQFVYADINQADLDSLPQQVVPPQHERVAHLNARYVRGLVPKVESYPEVALRLRLGAAEYVADWLPPDHGEPRVTPLHRGAGQLPTIGRAALFETLTGGIRSATADLRAALGDLANSSEDLYRLGGENANPHAVDVFVAFSVAGGTGAGIFYDYLHFIGMLFAETRLKPKIYPLVLMPSAFEDGHGGGRRAQLNAGRSLLDLFRLVDQQNAGAARTDLTSRRPGQAKGDHVSVSYPGGEEVQMGPGITQTGFLFSRPIGTPAEDLRRSVVSLVLSLVGTELDKQQSADGEQYQSFADSFINDTVERQSPAENGIGNQGVSTAQVTSLTVPFNELAGLVAAQLLRLGVEGLTSPTQGSETNTPHIRNFFTHANIPDIFNRPQGAYTEPQVLGTGAAVVLAGLNDRRENLREALGSLEQRLRRSVPEMLGAFDPKVAIHQLLGEFDPFRVQRILLGHAALPGALDQLGVRGVMRERRTPRPAKKAERFGPMPPEPPMLRDGRLGTSKVKWTDDAPAQSRQEQDRWYAWRTHGVWTEPWNTLHARWSRPMDHAEAELQTLTQALLGEAARNREELSKRVETLYNKRKGIAYLLPSGTFEQFCIRVRARIVEDLVEKGFLAQQNASDADILQALVGPKTWQEAFQLVGENSQERAMTQLREQIKTEVKQYFRLTDYGGVPLLPRLSELLAEAATPRGRFSEEDRENLRGKLAALIPAEFAPQAAGKVKILITYAAEGPNPEVEAYLRRMIQIPTDNNVAPKLRPTSTESISVVSFRSAMGITDLREVRDVLRTWSSAIDAPEPQDYLRWRQRTGYRFGYLATNEEHRVRILHRMLCAMWNGKVSVAGDLNSPDSVTIQLAGGVRMTLHLSPLVYASSWGSLLRAYEVWAFDDNAEIRRAFCTQLMREVPEGITGRPREPDELYKIVCGLAGPEIVYIDDNLGDLHSSSQARAEQLRSFWAETLAAARDYEFVDIETPFKNLSRIEQLFTGGAK